MAQGMTRRADLRDLDGREAVITASHVQKSYRGFTAVRDATFAVARGEIFGLLGPNGAGKTTTVECLQGLRRPDGGAIAVLGLDPVRQSRELRRRIGCQLQESALPDHIRVWEALELFASLTPGGRDWRDVMAEWGLAEKSQAAFHSLSGGQRQRLFVALAVVNGPEVVFLDEMTTGLDPAARRVAWDLIREIRERGSTVVLVTHFMEEAERLCDRIAVMDRGKVVALDSPRGLIAVARRRAARRVPHRAPTSRSSRACATSKRVRREGPRVVVEGRGAVLAHVAAALVAAEHRAGRPARRGAEPRRRLSQPHRARHGRMSGTPQEKRSSPGTTDGRTGSGEPPGGSAAPFDGREAAVPAAPLGGLEATAPARRSTAARPRCPPRRPRPPRSSPDRGAGRRPSSRSCCA